MTRIVPTAKGFMLITTQTLSHEEATHMADRLSRGTGQEWVVIDRAEYDDNLAKAQAKLELVEQMLKKFA